jgi:SAM-dependent methyltransferase
MADDKHQLDWQKVKQFAEQAMSDIGITMQGALSFIGDRLGIFKALSGAGWVTSVDLAERTALSERYLREWLAAMAAARYVEYDPATRKFFMPPENAMILANEDSPFFFGGFIEGILNVSMAPKVAEAFKNGKGVPQSEYPPETFEGIERGTAPMYQHHLVRKWLPAMPQVVTALSDGGCALDVGCGSGRAAITLAKAFPNARVFGYDDHPGSIERARVNARTAGLGDRVGFEVVDCTKLSAARWDFVTTFDVVHDSVDPVALLSSIRKALKPDGSYLMLEVNVSANLEDNLNPMGRMMYSMSTLYCMTVSLAHGGVGIGAVMGEPKARELCEKAGFGRFRRLPIDDLFSALYEVRP